MRYLILLTVMLSFGCGTLKGFTPNLSEAGAPGVEAVTDAIGERFSNIGDVDREFLAVIACGTVGATAYFIEAPSSATKEQRVLVAINAANRHGNRFFGDVLKDTTFLDLVTKKLKLDAGTSDAEKMIGLVRYFTMHLEDMRKLLRQVSPAAASSAGA